MDSVYKSNRFIIVAVLIGYDRCHVYGIFQDRGTPFRVRELRQTFDTPGRYGKGIDWIGYAVHDAVRVLLLSRDSS